MRARARALHGITSVSDATADDGTRSPSHHSLGRCSPRPLPSDLPLPALASNSTARVCVVARARVCGVSVWAHDSSAAWTGPECGRYMLQHGHRHIMLQHGHRHIMLPHVALIVGLGLADDRSAYGMRTSAGWACLPWAGGFSELDRSRASATPVPSSARLCGSAQPSPSPSVAARVSGAAGFRVWLALLLPSRFVATRAPSHCSPTAHRNGRRAVHAHVSTHAPIRLLHSVEMRICVALRVGAIASPRHSHPTLRAGAGVRCRSRRG